MARLPRPARRAAAALLCILVLACNACASAAAPLQRVSLRRGGAAGARRAPLRGSEGVVPLLNYLDAQVQGPPAVGARGVCARARAHTYGLPGSAQGGAPARVAHMRARARAPRMAPMRRAPRPAMRRWVTQ
jgi:hypothetical protein